MKQLIVSLLVNLILFNGFANTIPDSSIDKTPIWAKYEISLSSSKTYNNPIL